MNSWRKVAIGEVAQVFDGPHATPRTVSNGPIFLGIGALQDGRLNLTETRHVTPDDFKKWTRRVKPKTDDIVFSYETRLGQAAIIPEGLECCLGRRMGLVRVDRTKLDPRFFLYLYLSPPYQEFLRSRTIPGATVDRIALKEFPSFAISLPSIAEQLAISSTLSAIDDKIESNRRMNETLEAMARAIFKDWFVDFGPTRAKIEGRKPYLAPDIWALFPDRLDDKGKPEGWQENPLTAFFSIIGGGTPKTSVDDYWGGTIPWFSVVDTPSTGSVFVVATDKTITQKGLDESSARLVPEGTTIISARGTVGNLAIAGQPMAFNQSCYALQGEGDVGRCFVFLAAQNMVGRLQSIAHGSVFSTITRRTFEAVTLAMPPGGLLSAFEEVVQPLFARIKANVAESRTLAAIRDLLLPKLMSGEIRVSEVEILAKQAAHG